MFNEVQTKALHQGDILYLPYDKLGCKTYKYALTFADIASRYKEADALKDKSSNEVAAALTQIYERNSNLAKFATSRSSS